MPRSAARQHKAKTGICSQKLGDIDARRRELVGALGEFRSHERFLAEARQLIDDLNAERDTHSGVMQQINQVGRRSAA